MPALAMGASSDTPQHRSAPARAAFCHLAGVALAAMLVAGSALAGDAATVLTRAAAAARTQTYTGTILYQKGSRYQTSRLVHLFEAGTEQSKLVNLEGPRREVISTADEVRCYYSDAKVVRIEAPEFRNAFP